MPEESSSRPLTTFFIIGSVLAGANAVGIRFSNRELEPFWGGVLRFATAAVLLWIVMGLPFPRGRALAGATVFGLFNFGAAFGLVYYGLVEVHAGLGQVLLALVPLATLLLAVAERQESLHGAAILGTLLALAGIVMVSGGPFGEAVPLLSLLALVGGSLFFAQAAVSVRWFPTIHPVTMNAVAMSAGAVFLLVGSLIRGESRVLPQEPETWVALAYLVVVGSMVVFVLYVLVLQHWKASRAAYTFALVPLVTVLLSAWLDNEPIGLALVVGGVLVLAGVYIGAIRPTRTRRPTSLLKPE